MTAAEIARLAIILAPIAKDIVVEGSKLITTYRDDITQESLNKSLELSKSTGWPELTFERETL